VIPITPAQLKNILQSNILSLCPLSEETISDCAAQVEAGAHVLLAPPADACDAAEEARLAAVFKAAADKAFVAGRIAAPKEGLAESGGTLSYEECYSRVLRQAKFLEKMGVSIIFLTDFTDILTAKCALYATREGTQLPVCVGFTQQAGEAGVKCALSLLITLQAAEVSAAGVTGMDIQDALELLSDIQGFATVPLFAVGIAGQYLLPEDYEDYVPSFVHQKCAMLGLVDQGPAFTAAMTKAIWQLSPLSPDFPMLNAVSSVNETVFLDFHGKIVGKNRQLLEIKTEKLEEIKQALTIFNRPGAAPVCFHIKDIDVLRYAIMHYAGRPAVRSDEYGEILARELGAFVLTERETEQK